MLCFCSNLIKNILLSVKVNLIKSTAAGPLDIFHRMISANERVMYIVQDLVDEFEKWRMLKES